MWFFILLLLIVGLTLLFYFFGEKVGPQRYRLRFGRVDIFITLNLDWRTKPAPWWFARNYKESNHWSIQFPFVEIWGR